MLANFPIENVDIEDGPSTSTPAPNSKPASTANGDAAKFIKKSNENGKEENVVTPDDKKKQKSRKTTPNVYHNLKLIKNSKKTRPQRCEHCKKPFKVNKEIDAKFFVGHYCNRPFFNRNTGQMHPGTRNYYFCVAKKCLKN